MDATCNENNGSINLTVEGGTAPYDYDWNGAAGNVEDPIGLLSGDYDVIVTDVNGCTVSATITVDEPDALALNSIVSDALCEGQSSGSVDLSVSGGTGAGTYSYEWNDVNNQIIEDPIDLSAGSYTVLVTDDNGCTITTTVEVGEPTALSVVSSSQEATCGESNGSIDITVSGGTAPYSYDWNDPAPDVEDPTDLQAGSYDVVIMDANGCTLESTVSVSTPNALEASEEVVLTV